MTMSKAEKFIYEHTRIDINTELGWNNGESTLLVSHWLTPDQARRAVKIAREEIYEWLYSHSERYVYWMDEEFGKDDLINDLKQAIKDETQNL